MRYYDERDTREEREQAVHYRTRQYGSNRRWVLKALREVSYSIAREAEGVRDRDSRRKTEADEWSLVQILAYLRDSEKEDLTSARAILRRDGARLEERRAHYGPLEQDYARVDADELLQDYWELREELVWLLRDREEEWERAGVHPYRGKVTLDRLVHEVNERDLDVLWRLQRVRDALGVTRKRRRE
ncbi:MAG: hypothetical protein EXR66_04465 [Dehalococcoidia bacterium]|nr:hypothetical protein [Dehalococcoidia bacterium]